MAIDRPSLQLSSEQRAIAAASALDSVRAEGLDPSGIESALRRWVSGQLTISQVIQQELRGAQRLYGPPSSGPSS